MGATLLVMVDDHEITAMFSAVLARLGNLRPFMAEIGEIVTEDVQQNFQGRHDPEGRPWAPVSAAWAARKRLLGKDPSNILILSRMMMGSIHYTATNDSVAVGTNEPKAATHQFGAKRGEYGWKQIRRKLSGAQNWRRDPRRHLQTRFNTARVAIPWGNIPARPFLGVSRDARDEILAAGADYLDPAKSL